MRIACAFPSARASSGRGIDKTDWFEMTAEFCNRCLDPTDYRSVFAYAYGISP